MTVAQLKKMSQVELDDLCREKPAGPLPDGAARGTAIVLPGTVMTNLIADVRRLKVWKGKVFERDPRNPNRGTLRNKILPLGHLAIEAKVYKDKSWLDGRECIVLDYSETSLVAKKVRDEMGLKNVKILVPFCCTLEEGCRVLHEMEKHGLQRQRHKDRGKGRPPQEQADEAVHDQVHAHRP